VKRRERVELVSIQGGLFNGHIDTCQKTIVAAQKRVMVVVVVVVAVGRRKRSLNSRHAKTKGLCMIAHLVGQRTIPTQSVKVTATALSLSISPIHYIHLVAAWRTELYRAPSHSTTLG